MTDIKIVSLKSKCHRELAKKIIPQRISKSQENYRVIAESGVNEFIFDYISDQKGEIV